jgi:hypothetical protein
MRWFGVRAVALCEASHRQVTAIAHKVPLVSVAQSATVAAALTRRPKSRRLALSRVDIAVLLCCFSVLAVVAVPRHLSLTADTRRAELHALAANIGNAAEFAHALWLARQKPPMLSLPGGDVVMINGFPSAATVSGALQPPIGAGFAFSAGTWSLAGTRTCAVEYQPPEFPGALPSVVTIERGC